MLKRLVVAALAAAAALAAQTASPAAPSVTLDKPALETYFRHLLMWPPSVEMTIGDPSGAPMAGFYSINVHGKLGDKSRDEPFYVSADSKTVVRGEILDTTKSPFQADIELLKTDDQPFLGTPGAPVKIVEFADFQCPYCKQEASVIRQDLMEAFPGQIQLFFMDYPLASIHPFARGAAVLGRCIYAQNNGSFWKYHDWIFQHQSEITPDNLKDKALEYAKTDPDLDTAKLATCAVAPEPRTQVDRSEKIGDALKLTATPTFFINGRRMVGTIGLDDLKMVVAHEIAWAKAHAKPADCCSVQLALPGMTK
jgi:protein-disulfide isomerase